MSQLSDAIAGIIPHVTLSAQYYEPVQHVEELIADETLRKSILSSMCWHLDNAYVNQIRTIFFDLYRKAQTDNDANIDSMNDFIALMKEREFGERMLSEQGFDQGSGVYTLRQLNHVRVEWYDALNSQEAMPTLEELLAAEKPRRLSALSAAKLRMLAENLADGDAQMEKLMFENLQQREEIQAQFAHDNRQKLSPMMLNIERFVIATDVTAEQHFYDLPLPMQKRMVQNVVSIIERAIMQLATDRRLDVLAFASLSKQATSAMKAIKAVLQQPRFANCTES